MFKPNIHVFDKALLTVSLFKYILHSTKERQSLWFWKTWKPKVLETNDNRISLVNTPLAGAFDHILKKKCPYLDFPLVLLNYVLMYCKE